MSVKHYVHLQYSINYSYQVLIQLAILPSLAFQTERYTHTNANLANSLANTSIFLGMQNMNIHTHIYIHKLCTRVHIYTYTDTANSLKFQSPNFRPNI